MKTDHKKYGQGHCHEIKKDKLFFAVTITSNTFSSMNLH